MSVSVELKIKAKSLADEARTIRREELVAKRNHQTDTLNRLWLHRTRVVRPEARLTHLARGYLKGAPYASLERSVRPEKRLTSSDFQRIARMLVQYGRLCMDKEFLATELERWVEAPLPAEKAA